MIIVDVNLYALNPRLLFAVVDGRGLSIKFWWVGLIMMLCHVRTRVVVMSNLERDVCTTTVCVAHSL